MERVAKILGGRSKAAINTDNRLLPVHLRASGAKDMNKNARDWTFACIVAVFWMLWIIGFSKFMWVVTAP